MHFFSVPPMFYPFLTPLLNKGERSQYEFDGRNMDALQSLILLLQYRLTITTVSNIFLFIIPCLGCSYIEFF